MTELVTRRCAPCAAGTPPLPSHRVQQLLAELPGWSVVEEGKAILKKFQFKNYYLTMAFVNALAWVAHVEDHHPDLEVSYSSCTVRYSTHAVGGLSENDFICAAKVNALMESPG
ncbi:MAG TPA: 4a-hydroxytetrahydrobiopterin dehydratase [Polyangiaceae bacterium]|jgi:4a-hydroxytetrahydrobiopterin dehydratase